MRRLSFKQSSNQCGRTIFTGSFFITTDLHFSFSRMSAAPPSPTRQGWVDTHVIHIQSYQVCGEFRKVPIVLAAHGNDAPTYGLFVAHGQLRNGRNDSGKEELRVRGEGADMRQALFCNGRVDPGGGDDGFHGLVYLELAREVDVRGDDMCDCSRVERDLVF